MNNQVKLIEDIEKVIRHELSNFPRNETVVLGGSIAQLLDIAKRNTSIPTIKPGDTVWIIDSTDSSFFGREGIVESISKTDILRARLKGIIGDWPLSSLEVVE